MEQKLHDINYRYRRLLRTLQFKGNLIHESLQKHKDHANRVELFLPWLADAERKLAYHSQELASMNEEDIMGMTEFVKVSLMVVIIVIASNLHSGAVT